MYNTADQMRSEVIDYLNLFDTCKVRDWCCGLSLVCILYVCSNISWSIYDAWLQCKMVRWIHNRKWFMNRKKLCIARFPHIIFEAFAVFILNKKCMPLDYDNIDNALYLPYICIILMLLFIIIFESTGLLRRFKGD